MPETILDTVGSFTIRELTGSKRTLRLTSRALPYRPFELSGSQRHDITWYPGSPIGTLQNLGSKEEETTIRGYWKDRFIAASANPDNPSTAFAQVSDQLGDQPVSLVTDLAALVDDMRRQGQVVQVTWLQQSRRGLLSKFMQRWNTNEDVEWEITFVWTSQGDEQDQDFSDLSAQADLSDVPVELQEDLD
jgi:hypothetical protein